MKKALYFIFIVSTISFAQRADFFKEDITFRLDSLHFDVEGYYWFANNSDKAVNSEIFYPFPDLPGGTIDSIRLFYITSGQLTVYKLEPKYGMTFNLFIPPKDTILYQIGYRQKLTGNSALYILRSTKAWGKPLQQAEYKLITSSRFIIKKFSYRPDKIYNIDNNKIYYWKKSSFMPVKDMIFYF